MLQNVTTKTKCDVRNCKNNAAYNFEIKGRGKCFLCADCLEELFAEYRAHTVPKSPQNIIKKKQERRSMDE